MNPSPRRHRIALSAAAGLALSAMAGQAMAQAGPSGSMTMPDTRVQHARTSGMPAQGNHAESFWFGHPAARNARTDAVIRIDAEDIRFVPTTVTVRKGETVAFEVHDTGKLAHEFVLGDAREQLEHEKEMEAMPGMPMHDPNGISLRPGQTRILRWTFTRAGTIEYACHVPGHFAAGMKGTIHITG